MKKNLAYILFIFLSINVYGQNIKQDAIIILNREEQTYSQTKLESNYYCFEITIKISRRIKILSSYGMEQFATLYIPTIQDLNFKTELIELKAQTIKPSGATNIISKEAIKETTLPANIPFFREYNGKVKAMAFENLEIGDEIQYDFQIKYTSTSSYIDIFNSTRTLIPENHEIKEATYIINVKNNIQFKGVVINSNSKFIKSTSSDTENSTYTLNLKDIKSYKNEEFSVNEDNQPYFRVDIYKIDDYTPHDKWEEFTKEIKASRRSSIFFAGKTVKDIYFQCYNELTSVKKVLKVHSLIMTEIKKDPYRIYSVYKNYKPDMEDANQIFRLLNLLDINGSVLLVKSKFDGAIVKNFVSLRQFDDLIIEFYDNGKVHYFSIFDPYASLDEISAAYQGTEALKLAVIDKKESVSFTKIPVSNSANNIAKYDYTVNLKNTGEKISLNCSLKVQKKNQFFLEERNGYLLEKADKKINSFSKDITDNIMDKYSDCNVDTIILSKSTEQIDYLINYNYAIPSEQPENLINIKISDFYSSDFLMSEYEKERTTKAIFSFPREIITTFKVKSDDNYSAIPNLLLKKNFENEFARFQTDFKVIAPNVIEVTISYCIKQTELSPANWHLFLSFINAAHDAISQRIMFQK